MSNNFKLYPHGRYILTERDVTNTFDFKSYPVSNREKNEVLRTYDLYSIFEALVSNSDRYIYQDRLFPNNRHNNITMTEFILDQDPFTDNNAGAIIRQAKDSSSGKLTMKKTSSDTNVLDLEYSPNDTFILYKYNDNIYNSSDDTEGDIFYYFTDDYNPIKNSKCIIISNSRTNGLSKKVDYLPSGSSRTDSFMDPHINNLVYKSDLPTPINSIEDGTGKDSIQSSWGSYAGGKYSLALGSDVYAYGDYSQALGYNTITGIRGYSIVSFDTTNKTYTLNSISGLRTGKKCYALFKMKNGHTTDNSLSFFSGEITAIDSNTKTITVSEFVEPSNLGTGSNDYSYYLIINRDFKLGDTTITALRAAHAEGISTTAIGDCSHAEGSSTIASGDSSHAEGQTTEASGRLSHAEGSQTKASGEASHAEGSGTIALGYASHAEGDGTKASHMYAHAEGDHTIASEWASHTEGKGTIAKDEAQHVQGKYNIESSSLAHILGNGTRGGSPDYTISRSNAHTIDWSGNAWFAGDVYTGSTSGTNKDEGSKVLATKEYVDSKTLANYTYDKVVYVLPPSEITTTTGTTAFTQDSEARTFTAVGAINGEDPVTYENVITLTADVKNILIYSVGSLIGDVGPADQIAQISITDISGAISQILNTRGCSENLINTGPLTSGSKLTLTYTSGTYEPSNAQQVFTLEYYTETVTDASLQNFISSKVTHESTDRRQMDMILQKNIDAQYSDLQTQIFDLQGHVIENMLDAVIFRLSNLDNKSEFRFFGPSNSGVTDLGLSFEDVSLTSGDKFEMSATFQTASSGCTFEITESTSVKVKLTGDDVTNGVLSPVANKVYEIAFYWNGLFMSGVVRGVEHEAVDTRKKITITNMTKTDFSPDLYVFSDEGCTNIIGTLEAWGGSQEFAVDGNLIYAGYKKTDAASILANSSSGCTPTLISNSTYHAYKIEITSSPASIDLRGK